MQQILNVIIFHANERRNCSPFTIRNILCPAFSAGLNSRLAQIWCTNHFITISTIHHDTAHCRKKHSDKRHTAKSMGRTHQSRKNKGVFF